MTLQAIPPRRLHIAFVCFSSARGGLEMMLVRLAASLHSAGHSVIVISPPHSGIAEGCQQAAIRHCSLSPSFRYCDPIASGRLRQLFTQRGTEVVVVGTSKDISTVVLAKRNLKSLRVAYFQQMQSGIVKKDLFHRWSYSHLDRWITLTMKMKESTVQTTTVPAEIIDVVPLGVDLERFSADRYQKPVTRTLFRLPKDKLIVGLAGRLDPQKGQETLLRSVSLVRKRLPRAHFVLVGEETRGESGYLSELQRIVESEGIGSSVQFLPFTNRVPELLSAFDVTVMPSYSETYGYLAIESMAMGVPVVGTNAGGLPEIIDDQKTGILVSPKDHRALAGAIISLLSNRKRRAKMSQNARMRAAKSFDYSEGVRLFQTSLERALAGRG